jgi:hypothetical protein
MISLSSMWFLIQHSQALGVTGTDAELASRFDLSISCAFVVLGGKVNNVGSLVPFDESISSPITACTCLSYSGDKLLKR